MMHPLLLECANRVIPMKKKDDSIRLCVDYRQLNRKII